MGEGSTKQWGTETLGLEICGRERDGGGVHGVNKMDTTGTFRKENREFEGDAFGVDYRG